MRQYLLKSEYEKYYLNVKLYFWVFPKKFGRKPNIFLTKKISYCTKIVLAMIQDFFPYFHNTNQNYKY